MTIRNQIKESYERYILIIKIFEENKDKNGIELIKELIEKITTYIVCVDRMETFNKIHKFRLETKEYQERLKELDERRTICHNALMSHLYRLNKYLFKRYEEAPIGGIYSLDPSTISSRLAVSDWAGYLAEALYKHKIIKQKPFTFK